MINLSATLSEVFSAAGARKPAGRRGKRLAAGACWLLVCAALAGAGCFRLPVSSGDAPASTGALPAREELPPPTEFSPQLAPPTSVAAAAIEEPFEARIQRVLALAAAVEERRQAASGDLIVLPGRQTTAPPEELARYDRWEIRLPPDVTVESYARQLDFFGIELGVIGGSNEIIYLSNLTRPHPDKRSKPLGQERRVYMVWKRGALAEADRTLAARAEVHTRGKVIALFCPPRVEKELADAERAAAARNKFARIRSTAFGILAENKGFKFYVIDQQPIEDTP